MTLFGMEITEIGTWITVVLGVITLWATLIRPVRAVLKNVKQQNAAVCVILAGEISRVHREFTEIGKIDRKALELVIHMYDNYKELGGNGYIEAIMDQIKKIPIVMPEVGVE